MTPDAQEAVYEIKQHFRGFNVLIGPDKDGGACVIVEDVALGAPYAQPDSWIGFHITHACPYADVYPHFVRHDLSRSDATRWAKRFLRVINFRSRASWSAMRYHRARRSSFREGQTSANPIPILKPLCSKL
jgi:hypothetical protein